ncbi:MAG: hypothetical protein JSS83_14755 [Cyanobacteria bacterium SZAS LIN-3]|nr:hypothetical protein [Cyanobacteria bacterium SZAS LIN-3]
MIDGSGHDGHGGHGGIDVGHSGGLSIGDLDVGHGHHDKGHHHDGFHHGGHDHDGKVTVESLMVAHSHSGAPGFGGFGHVHASVDAHSGMPDHGHLGGWSTGDGVDQKELLNRERAFLDKVEAAAKDPLRRNYGVHVVSHGYIDLPRIFTELGTKLGAIRVDGTTGNFNGADISLNELTDWSRYTPPFSRLRPPAGYYSKASGITHIWRQYWQVAPKTYWWNRPKGRLCFDRSQSTYLEVSIITWFFAAVGDYETRIDLKIVSLPVLDQYDKTWAIRGEPLKKHQKLCEGLVAGLFDALKFAKPTEWARDRRAKLVLLQTTRPAAVEQSGADLDTLFDNFSDETQFKSARAASAVTLVSTAVSAPPPSTPPAPTGKEVTVRVEIPSPKLRTD